MPRCVDLANLSRSELRKRERNQPPAAIAPAASSRGVDNTPRKAGPSNRGNSRYTGCSETQVSLLRREEMNTEIDGRLETDIAWVVDRAQPADAASKALADKVTRTVATRLESLITGKPQPQAASTVGAPAQSDESRMVEHAHAVIPWFQKNGNPSGLERPIYKQLSAFMLLVAQLLKCELAGRASNATGAGLQRLILPYEKVDTNPEGADDGTKIDVGLRSCPVNSPVEAQPDASYGRALAVVEAKGRSTKALWHQAYAQLFDYSHNVYYCQIDRRFIWGLACCGSEVRACIFSNYRAFASPAIDMTDKAGRSELVRLLVGWSLCDNDRLGYDDTIVWNSELQCYEISVPCADRPGESVPYYTDAFIIGAERLFSRHCRCFLATSTRPTAPVTEDNPLVPDCVIKDTWTFHDEQYNEPALDTGGNSAGSTSTGNSRDNSDGSRGDGNGEVADKLARVTIGGEAVFCWPPENFDLSSLTERSEIGILRKIDARLRHRVDLDGRYPRILDGGWVFQGSDTQRVLDSTRLILGDLDSAQQSRTPFCVHMRYAMTPIGEPLKYVCSIPELIVVLHDVMRCHAAIYDECRILHRDISDSNILIVRPKSGGVHGMLIDFDCAVDKSVTKRFTRPECSGSLPYMSVGNLERLPIPRTQLDDWESVIYLICWLGAFGINDESRIVGGNLPEHLDEICRWSCNTLASIARCKRMHMQQDTFQDSILSAFDAEQKYARELCNLAKRLHKTLFYNKNLPVEARKPCHGAPRLQLDSDASDSDDMFGISNNVEDGRIDPFVKRVPYADQISNDLLKVLQRFADSAQNML